MDIKIKRFNKNSVIPSYAKSGDAGMDLTAVTKTYDEYGNTVYGTGLGFEIPEGYFGLLVPRSSNAKTDLRLTNSSGVLDSGYRGEVLFKYRNDNFANLNLGMKAQFLNGDIGFSNEYEVGDRIGQLIILPYPQIQFVEVEDLENSERGIGGYGHTGK